MDSCWKYKAKYTTLLKINCTILEEITNWYEGMFADVIVNLGCDQNQYVLILTWECSWGGGGYSAIVFDRVKNLTLY